MLSLLLALLLPLLLLVVPASGHASKMELSSNCPRALSPGTVIMGVPAVRSTSRVVKFAKSTSPTVSIPCGTVNAFTPGETIVVSLSSTSGEWVVDLAGSPPSQLFTSGGCSGLRAVDGGNVVTSTESGAISLSATAGFASAKGEVSITDTCTIYATMNAENPWPLTSGISSVPLTMSQSVQYLYFVHERLDDTKAVRIAVSGLGDESIYASVGEMPFIPEGDYQWVSDFEGERQVTSPLLLQPFVLSTAPLYIVVTYWACFGSCSTVSVTVTATEVAATETRATWALGAVNDLVGARTQNYVTVQAPEDFDTDNELFELCFDNPSGGAYSWTFMVSQDDDYPTEKDKVDSHSHFKNSGDTECFFFVILPSQVGTAVHVGIKM